MCVWQHMYHVRRFGFLIINKTQRNTGGLRALAHCVVNSLAKSRKSYVLIQQNKWGSALALVSSKVRRFLKLVLI